MYSKALKGVGGMRLFIRKNCETTYNVIKSHAHCKNLNFLNVISGSFLCLFLTTNNTQIDNKKASCQFSTYRAYRTGIECTKRLIMYVIPFTHQFKTIYVIVKFVK